MNRCALLVIDVQVAAFDGKVIPGLHKADDLLERTSRLIRAARSAGTPVVFVQHCEPEGRPLAQGTIGWAIHPSVSPEPSDSVVLKRESSAFEGTNLQELLGQLGVDTLIACGIQSEILRSQYVHLGTRAVVERLRRREMLTAPGQRDDDEASLLIDRQNSLLAKTGRKSPTLCVTTKTNRRQLIGGWVAIITIPRS